MMSDDPKSVHMLKSSDENTMNVPKICLLPQPTAIYPDNSLSGNYPLSINPSTCSNYKFSHRDSGTFDSLSMGSKVNINSQIKTVHNWFKHLPGSDQARLMATLFPSVHFDYMAMIASIAIKQTNYISNEVLDYQKLEEEANNLESVLRLIEEPSILAVNLLSRLPLLYPCCPSDSVDGGARSLTGATATARNTTSPCVHRLYAKLLTQVFSQEFADIEEILAVKQLATLTANHPNLQPQLQSKLTELAIERQLLDEKDDTRRPRRPGALSPFGPPGHIAQTHSFSLLVPPFMAAAAGCLSASASPQSACSYNSSGFISGAESCGRRNQPPLSPQSSTSSCAGDDQILSHSVSYDHDASSVFPPGNGNGNNANGNDTNGSGSSSGDGRTASLQGQSSIDTPTPSSASSVLLVAKQTTTCSPPCTMPCDCVKSSSAASLALSFSDSISFFVKDDEVDSEASFSMNRDSMENDRNMFLEKGSGMSYVPSWLKSLRLHKYAGLFQQLNYEEMLLITDEWLESKNVTKGARNKILVNIQKLETRESTLRQVEAELMSSGSLISLRTCLNEIRNILMTPIKPFSEDELTYTGSSLSGGDSPPAHSINGNIQQGDLPNQIVRCLSKVCSHLLVSKKIDEESYLIFLQILDIVIEHESFTIRHKNLCRSWRAQLEGTRGLPRKMTSWLESQRVGYRKSNKQIPLQSCSFPNVSSATMRPATPSFPIMEPYCPILSSIPYSTMSTITRPPLPNKDVPQSFPVPGMASISQHQQQLLDMSSQVLIKRQVERTLSAPNQSALMDLFLQCQSYLPQNTDQGFDKPPVSMSQIFSMPLGSSSFCVVPPWPPGSHVGLIDTSASGPQSQPATDISPNGSQDPATAEINWNLDLLAREVTELAIRDPDSPDK